MQHREAPPLPGPDYFDEEAKFYGRLLNFAKSHFAVPDSGVACLLQNFNNLPSILPLRQNNLVAAVSEFELRFFKLHNQLFAGNLS